MDDIGDTRPYSVKEAIELLEKAANITEPELRATKMQGPISTLRDYLDDNPGSEYRENIERWMANCLRDHAVRLSTEFPEPDLKQWLQSFALFVIADRAMVQVLAKRPDLESWFREFMASIPPR
jgi:hypothetical protein